MPTQRYSGCGLDDVIVENAPERFAESDLPALHRAIAEAIVLCHGTMTAAELIFLRNQLWLSRAWLMRWLRVSPLAIRRWEEGSRPIERKAETLVRLLVIERLGLKPGLSVHEIAARAAQGPPRAPIRIDAGTPGEYRPLLPALPPAPRPGEARNGPYLRFRSRPSSRGET